MLFIGITVDSLTERVTVQLLLLHVQPFSSNELLELSRLVVQNLSAKFSDK